ncbi:hypothetical protein [Solirubrobacter soli]|uniref:hypothetical protein n=1 Tax=Solirubrobacter soli TaxID=363832 RepID=UPI0003FA6790|nr:hypothetical protein [Solirubrobacter soli]
MRHLLFLHGIRNDDPRREWLVALNQGLRQEGLRTIEERGYTIHAPSYLDLLQPETALDGDRPQETYKRADDAGYARAGARYWRTLHSLEESGIRRFEVPPSILGNIPAEGPHANLVRELRFQDAQRYRRDAKRRHAIVRRILQDLPRTGELVIVAHSLGSVVARDLIYHLPPGCELTLLITIGTPLALGPMREHLKDANRRFPYETMGAWLNLVGAGDMVTGHRGLAQIEGQALDVFIDTNRSHDATAYLANPCAGVALDWYDQRPEEPADDRPLPDRPFPAALLAVIIGAQYGLRLGQVIENADKRARFIGAREFVLPDLAQKIAGAGFEHVTADQLLRDNAAWLGARPIADDELLACLLAAFMGNPVERFQIDVSREERVKALELLARDLRRSRQLAVHVQESERSARRAHKDSQVFKRAALAVVGLAVIAAAPALVFAAAPAGLAGGAAFVAGLAALGPGGMLGGLGIISLMGGAGGLTAGRALLAGSPAQVEQTVIFLQAYARARHLLHADNLIVTARGHQEWFALIESEGFAADQLSLLSLFSDDDAPVIKELKSKLKTIDRALAWFREEGLAPAELPAGDE